MYMTTMGGTKLIHSWIRELRYLKLTARMPSSVNFYVTHDCVVLFHDQGFLFHFTTGLVCGAQILFRQSLETNHQKVREKYYITAYLIFDVEYTPV